MLYEVITAGIGLFIAFIGLQNAGIIVNNDATFGGFARLRRTFAVGGVQRILQPQVAGAGLRRPLRFRARSAP